MSIVFKPVSIGIRLILGFLVLALLVGVVSAVAYRELHKLRAPLTRDIPQGLKEIETTSHLDGLAQKIRYYDQVLTESARNYAYTNDRKWKYRYRNIEPQLEGCIKEATETGDAEDQKTFSDVYKAKLGYVDLENKAIAAVDRGDAYKARDILESGDYWQLKEEYKRGLEAYVESRGKKYGQTLVVTAGKVDSLVQETDDRVKKSLHWLVTISLFSLLLAVGLGFLVARSILIPIFDLRNGAERIGRGDLDHRIPLAGEDEIGELARSFNEMTAKLKESYTGLEGKVQEKTRELAHKVKQIETQNRILEEQKRATLNVLEDLESAKQKIETEKVEYEALLASIGDGMVATDEEGRVMMMNQQAALMLGCRIEEGVGFPFEEAVLCEDEKGDPVRREKRAVSLALQKGHKIVASAYYVRRDKTRFPVAITVSPILLEGKTIGAVEIFRDVTREKEIDRMKTDFISTVSHELRTPLTVIREGVSLVLDGILGETSTEQRKFLALSLEDIDRLKRIIDNLLDVSKIEAGKVEIRREMIDLVSLAEGVRSTFHVRAETKGVELRAKFSHPKVEVYADKDKIIQVFTNLIGNALKFTEKGHIEIGISDDGSLIQGSVRDTGKGISPEDVSKVFSKFQQFGRQESGGEKGTGLGLSIAKGIVELHKGKIWVESELGRGTQFLFTLPRYTAQELFRDYIAGGLEEANRSGSPMSAIIASVERSAVRERPADRERVALLVARLEQLTKKVLRRQGDTMIRDTHCLMVLLPGTAKENALVVADRIQRSFTDDLARETKGTVPEVICKVAGYPEDGSTQDDLIAKIF
jgi:PAS domain S-box-containing protein